MPNVLPRGLFGRIGTTIGAPAEPVELKATVPGSLVPANVIQVWCGSATGVPQIVWSSLPSQPTGAAATFAAAPSQMTVTWTLPAVVFADSYEIRRPDGSVAGTASGGSTVSFVDSDPRPLSGSYTVVPKLGGVYGTPVATNSVNLTGQTQSLAATWNAGLARVDVSWTHPTWGQPDGYNVYIDGVFIGPLPGSATSWNAVVGRGAAHTFGIHAVLSGLTAGSIPTDSENVPASEPTGVFITGISGGIGYGFTLVWYPPSGGYNGFEVEAFRSSWATPAYVSSPPMFSDYGDGGRFTQWGSDGTTEYGRVRATSAFGNSDWVQVGPQVPF